MVQVTPPGLQGLAVFAVNPSSPFTVSPELAEGSSHECTAPLQARGQRGGYKLKALPGLYSAFP